MQIFFELKGWDTLIDLSKISHISIFGGSHEFVKETEYTLFSSKEVTKSVLVEPRLKIWYSTDADPFTFTCMQDYKIHQNGLSPQYNQREIQKLIDDSQKQLKELYNKIKKALNVYKDEEEDTSEATETVY